jgi:hypothetical protein
LAKSTEPNPLKSLWSGPNRRRLLHEIIPGKLGWVDEPI